MDDPTQAVDNLFRSPGKFNEQQLRVILAFMNEMDAGALQHIKSDPEEDVMRTLARMQQNSHGRGDEEDIPLINFNDATESAGGILKSNNSMFQKYRTSLGRFGGDIYRDATNNSYEYASKVLAALGGLAGVGSVSAAVAAANGAASLMTSMAVRYLMGGVTGISLAGVAVISLRNHLGAQQKLSNKELLDTMKRMAEARIGLNKFFAEVRVKLTKEADEDKAARAVENYWTNTVPSAERNRQPVDRVERLLFTTLKQPGTIHSRILLEDNANYVALGRGRDSSISRDEMKLVADVAQAL